MIPITTYQSMCSNVVYESHDDIVPSRHMHSMDLPPSRSSRVPPPLPSQPRSMEVTKKKQHNDPIPLYFAWNRLDPDYKDEEHRGSKENGQEARPPPQCRLDDSEKDMPPKEAPAATRTASSSHHFLVDPNLINDDGTEPFVTEYADKYRAWTISLKNQTNTKTNKGRRQEECGVELALRGMGISPTLPTRMQRIQLEPTIVPSNSSTGSSRRQSRSEAMGPSPTLLAVGTDAPVVITCDNRTAKTSEMDEQSCLTGTTAPSTPTGSASSFRCGSGLAKEDTVLLVPSPTPQKNALAEKDGDMWIITSGRQQQHKPTSKPRSKTCTGSKLHETRRDMAFWKSSSSSLGVPCPATPNHSVSKGRARRFGEKNKVGSRSTHIRSTSAAAQSCPSPQKLSKMLLTSRRGLSSTKLFPRLPNDPFRKNSLKRKV